MSDTDLEQFVSELGKHAVERDSSRIEPVPTSPNDASKSLTSGTPVQWLSLGDSQYIQVTETIKKLPVGTYTISTTNDGTPIFKRLHIITDKLIAFPDSKSDAVISGISKFWKAKDKFKKLGQIHKRGILLWGPPGSGKTTTLMMLCRDLEAAGGMIIHADHPGLASIGLRQLRKIEPNRPLICLLEDLDELVRNHGESHLLQLLDGENQVDNICFIATTNYPALLDKRFINRPSRFDEVVKIGMPSAESRRIYLDAIAGESLGTSIDGWVEDTDGFSLAHLRELVVSVFCLDASYEDVMKRLKIMTKCAFDERKFGLDGIVEQKKQSN